jgi:hypothetical protein
MLGFGLQLGLPWLYAIDPCRIGIKALTILLLNFHVEFLNCIFLCLFIFILVIHFYLGNLYDFFLCSKHVALTYFGIHVYKVLLVFLFC